MKFHEKAHAFIAAKYYVYLTETYGERGRQAFIRGTRYAQRAIRDGQEREKNPAGIKSFEYHCAHLYWAYHQVTAAIFQSQGEAVCQKVLEDFDQNCGRDTADTLWGYRETDFNVCD